MTVTFDSSILLSYYQSRAGVPATGLGASGAASRKVAPTAPWSGKQDPAATSALVKQAMLGHKLIDENAAKLDLSGASSDYKKMFALYQGLGTLSGVASQMDAKGLTALDKTRIERIFANGMAEIQSYVDDLQLDQLRLKTGDVATQMRSKLGVPRTPAAYTTPPLMTGSSVGPVPAFQGDVQFNIAVKRLNTTTNVAIDLSEMGSQTRDLPNVMAFINSKLAGAGVYTRVASERVPGAPRTQTIGGKTVTLAPSPDTWVMKIKADSSETLTFSAPATEPAVYVAQTVGDPDPDKTPSTKDGVVQNQLLKFQTETSAAVPAPVQKAGEANWVDGRVFASTLDKSVVAVRATQMAPDGSVYMLADVNGQVNGQDIKGTQDVALLKYDAAGKLIYTRTLGASDQASGMALAVSADGKVAIAGAVKGQPLGGAVQGALNSTGAFDDYSDSFVTVFDADGQELWTQQRGARQDDEATDLAFGADGTVYVAGRAKSVMPGSTAVGGADNYIEAFKADAKGVPKAVFTQQFGTAGADRPAGMVMDGNFMITASVEDGRGVLRRFDVSSGTPTLVSTRDIGDLKGGDIAGIALDGGNLVIAGTSGDGTLNAGAVKSAYKGGSDAFAARMSADLSVGAGDTIAYYGGAGDDKGTALSVSNGQVFIAGSAGTDLPNQAPVGKKDGFLAQIDLGTGAVGWSRRFTGKDGIAAPTSIAVDATGSSVLDRIGLPKGVMDLSDSTQLTAVSALRAGDQFTVKVGTGATKTVKIDTNETLDTLVTKIKRAVGFQAKVTIATVSGQRLLQIAPLNDRTIIEIGAGSADKNALAMLGLPEGVIRATKVVDGKTVAADGKGNIYGLGIPSDLNLSTPEQVRHAVSELTSAQGVIRTAYKDLVAAASPATSTAQKTATGPVPAYLSNQIANYQAALDRLGG